jgi:hypothetical protein
MLTKVEISTDQGTTLELPLQDPSTGYLVKSIEGLDPVKATIVSSSFALMDGEQYQSSRRESRNILMKLGLEANYITETTRDLRKRLYSFLMPKSHVRLRFFVEEEPTVEIYGRVESFESPSFTKDPEATISLICHQPDFYNPVSVVLEGDTVADISEFLVSYEGTVESGVVITLTVDRDLADFTVYHRPSDGVTRVLEFVEPLIAGDILKISTISGAKYATRTRAGLTESVLYGVSPYSNWINLFPGPNNLRVYAEGAPVPYTIEYTDKFGGI